MMEKVARAIKKALGNDPKETEIVAAKRAEAHDIKNQITTDLLKVNVEVKRVARRNQADLDNISLKIRDVTREIAKATGRYRTA